MEGASTERVSTTGIFETPMLQNQGFQRLGGAKIGDFGGE
jgi:hypothetical protein